MARRSRPVPVWLLAAAVGACVVAALVVGTWWSALALLPVVGLMAWLTRLVWARLTTGERALRVVVLAGLLAWVVVVLTRG